jgi:hypothetical protein
MAAEIDTLDIEQLLQEHQETQKRIHELGVRPLSPALKALMWTLRIYVILMIIAVVVNVTQSV